MNAAPHRHETHKRLSRNQDQVLSCLREAGEPLGAYAILDRLRESGISHPPTVYRALSDLVRMGMVHRLQSRSAFVACDHGKCDGRLAFAICRECQKVVEISLSKAQEEELLDLAPKAIAADQVILELCGLCEACAQPAASQ
jgi:Fur family transcriptional regulator, zinc uptake regulator